MIRCPGCDQSFDPLGVRRRGDMAQCPHCGGWIDATAAAARQGDEVKCPCGNVFSIGWREVRRGMVQCPECGGWVDVEEHLAVQKPKPKVVKCPHCEVIAGEAPAAVNGPNGKLMVLCAGCGGWYEI
jgi:hypothetical protein